jgi:hypothetical protein
VRRQKGVRMAFKVMVCEVATGIVCYPDGRRWAESHGPRPDPTFDTRAEAEGWCVEYASRRPEFECVVITHDERYVATFRRGEWA